MLIWCFVELSLVPIVRKQYVSMWCFVELSLVPIVRKQYVSMWCFVELSLVPIVRKQFAYEASLFDKLVLSYYAPAFHVTAVDSIPSPHKHCLMGHLCL